MYKDEVVLLHDFLVRIKVFLEKGGASLSCFEEYEKNPVRPYHIHRKKKEHEAALFLLAKCLERFFRENPR
jgi:hypothetical protein